MPLGLSADRLRRLVSRIRERLWVKPLAVCLLSIAGVFVAKLVDRAGLHDVVPTVSTESLDTVLSVMAASMLVIATFAVGSMVAAFASASTTATPRSVSVVIADDGSQNALSTFIGAFIFSVVALTAMKNEYFGPAGLFTIFALTVAVFAIVILTFVRWVDRIARLGRMGTTIDAVERVTAAALERRRAAPTLRAALHVAADDATPPAGRAVYADTVGYVQHVDVAVLQTWAESANARVTVAALPGTFAAPGRPLAYAVRAGARGAPGPTDGSRGSRPDDAATAEDDAALRRAFTIGGSRQFDDDPRFGLVVLAEIAGRALSPAVNDPGTAIDVIGTLVRLFAGWQAPSDVAPPPTCDRVAVPALRVRDLFDDAFTVIARDGAGAVEVAVRLQKALVSLAAFGDPAMRAAAEHHARLALTRAESAMSLEADRVAVRAASLVGGGAIG